MFLTRIKPFIFTLALAIGILIVFFTTLNYFNVLRLDTGFPFLGFLPHQNSPVSTAPNQPQLRVPVDLQNNPVVESFYANVSGKITKIQGNTVTITSQGAVFSFMMTPTISIVDNAKIQTGVKALGNTDLLKPSDLHTGDAIITLVKLVPGSLPQTSLIRIVR